MFKLNACYMALSVLLVSLQVTSYKIKAQGELICLIAFLLGVRNSLRFFDIENIGFHLSDPDNPDRLTLNAHALMVGLQTTVQLVVYQQIS